MLATCELFYSHETIHYRLKLTWRFFFLWHAPLGVLSAKRWYSKSVRKLMRRSFNS